MADGTDFGSPDTEHHRQKFMGQREIVSVAWVTMGLAVSAAITLRNGGLILIREARSYCVLIPDRLNVCDSQF